MCKTKCMVSIQNNIRRCFMCATSIYSVRDELSDDWGENLDETNEIPLAGTNNISPIYLFPLFPLSPYAFPHHTSPSHPLPNSSTPRHLFLLLSPAFFFFFFLLLSLQASKQDHTLSLTIALQTIFSGVHDHHRTTEQQSAVGHVCVVSFHVAVIALIQVLKIHACARYVYCTFFYIPFPTFSYTPFVVCVVSYIYTIILTLTFPRLLIFHLSSSNHPPQCCNPKCNKCCTSYCWLWCCCCCTRHCNYCYSGSCCPCLSCVPCAKANDKKATIKSSDVDTKSFYLGWRGFVPMPALYDLVFEANRSQFLSVWNLAMFFLTLTLLLSPLSFGDLHNVSCQAALGFTPSYRSWYNNMPNQTDAYNPELTPPTFLARLAKGLPWSSNDNDKQRGASAFDLQRSRPVEDWSEYSYQQSLVEARDACEAACASDDVDVVANAYFMSSTDVFSLQGIPSKAGYYDTNNVWIYDPTVYVEKSAATCGYFRSQYSAPPSSSVDEAYFSNLNLYMRPLLLAAVNTRMNRFFGWAGIFWIAAVSFDISVLSNRFSDLKFCPTPFDFTPKTSGWYTYPGKLLYYYCTTVCF